MCPGSQGHLKAQKDAVQTDGLCAEGEVAADAEPGDVPEASKVLPVVAQDVQGRAKAGAVWEAVVPHGGALEHLSVCPAEQAGP